MNNGVILDKHNRKIKRKPAPPTPLAQTSRTYFILEDGKAFKSNVRQLLVAGQAWRGIYPSPHHTPPLLFRGFPFSFVSYRKMFLPFRHNRRKAVVPVPILLGRGGLGNRGRSRAAWLTVPLGSGPRSQGFLLRL